MLLKKQISKGSEPNFLAVFEGKLLSAVADLKDFIKITVKGSENALRNEIHSEINGLENRLTTKIDNIGKKVDSHETRLSHVENEIGNHVAHHP